jgi:tRNA threonylcarbamoyl adenosine modification protein YeaZ
MKILALEFSSPQRSVAVVQGRAEATRPASSEVVEGGGKATRAFSLIEGALRQAQLERQQIECLAVGLGPGSYTGIRVAIALAQGWQLAREVKILGLSSADAIAAQAQAEGLTGPVAVVIDAQRGEFYLATYEVSATGWREVQPLRLAGLVEVESAEGAGHVVVGPEATSWFPAARVVFPRASTLGRLALGRTDFVAGEHVEPIYLRPPAFVKAPPPRVLPS